MSDFSQANKEFQNINRIRTAQETEQFRLSDLDKAKKEYDRLNSAYASQKEALAEKHEKELEQARNNTLKDEYGQEIPVEMVKKTFGMRQETLKERTARLERIANTRYEKELHRLDFRLERAGKRVEYYENKDIINRVSDDEMSGSYSEKRKTLLKSYLLANVESDRSKRFTDAEDEKKEAFFAFLDAVAEYAKFNPQITVELLYSADGGSGKLNEDAEERDTEILKYQKIRQTLSQLKKKAKGDASLLQTAESYDHLLSGIADGDLQMENGKKAIVVSRQLHSDKEQGKTDGIADVVPADDVPLFAHEPSVNDLVQGMVGDCALVTTLGGIMATDPQRIKNCMRDNHDGTVTVRFFKVHTLASISSQLSNSDLLSRY